MGVLSEDHMTLSLGAPAHNRKKHTCFSPPMLCLADPPAYLVPTMQGNVSEAQESSCHILSPGPLKCNQR